MPSTIRSRFGLSAWFYIHYELAGFTLVWLIVLIVLTSVDYDWAPLWVLPLVTVPPLLTTFFHALLIVKMVSAAKREGKMLVHGYSSNALLSIFGYSVTTTVVTCFINAWSVGTSLYILIDGVHGSIYVLIVPFLILAWSFITLAVDIAVYKNEKVKIAGSQGQMAPEIGAPIEDPEKTVQPHEQATAKA